MSEIIDIEDQERLSSKDLIALRVEAEALKTKLFGQSNKAIFYQPDLSEHLAKLARKQVEVGRMLQTAIDFLEGQE